MKKFYLLLVLACGTSGLFSQTLFTYGNSSVNKDEFLRAYNKNKTDVPDKSKAIREYLELYIRFKLKVKAAQEMHLDTLPNLQSDLDNFRGQIEQSYLNDDKEVNVLVNEAFTRSQKDIHIMHFYIPVDKGALPADTVQAFNAAQTAFKSLNNHVAFSDIVSQLQKQSVSSSWSDLGYITVFTVPYEFENIIYALKPGQVSKPYRSSNGYHIFQSVDERKPAGKWKTAQIMIALPPSSGDDEKVHAKMVADSVYKLLQAGANFGELAKKVSNDKMTYMTGGLMPEYGTGKFDYGFEKNVFALKKDSDYTMPFQTEFGYHIVKRISVLPIPTEKSEAYFSLLKQQVMQDVRISAAKDIFLVQVLKQTGYKKNAINEKALWEVTDSFYMANKKITVAGVNENTVLHTFKESRITVKDWLEFIKGYKGASGLYKGESYPELMKKYIALSANEYYRKRLEYYSPEFKSQLNEFKEGNMLFEVMERNVWTKASADSVGLKNYYDLHKEKYTWNESADAILISSGNESHARDAALQLKNGKDWRQLVEDNSTQLQADSGRYELTQIPTNANTKLSAGIITEPVINPSDGTASFVKVIRLYPSNQQRSFEEARGLVINDYQNFIEEKWIEELKKKYPVKVNESVLKTMLN